MSLTESFDQDTALTWFGELDYTFRHGPLQPRTISSQHETLVPLFLSGEVAARSIGV